MKRSIIVLTMLAAWATMAWAGEAIIHPITWNVGQGTSFTRMPTSGGNTPYDAMRWDGSGSGIIVYNTEMPAQRFLGFRLKFLSPDATPTGNICYQICVGVAKDGQSRDPNLMDMASCTLPSNQPLGAQWVEFTETFGATSIVPKDVTDTVCVDDAACAGADLAIELVMTDPAACNGGAGSTNHVDFQLFKLIDGPTP